MAARYKQYSLVVNDSRYYAPLRRSRGLKSITQYGTITMSNPTVAQRASITTTTHVWKYGDRLYKLANIFYSDTRYWWIIAWWNGYPTEADIPTGAALTIPTNLEQTLRILGF